MTKPQAETLSFEAEIKQLMDLVANSLYSNKEIFLRELVSNSSDAIDKLRYEALSDEALYEGEQSDLHIELEFDEEAKTITVRDNGIGMTREEAIANLGTIAKSGTKAFKDMLETAKENKEEGSQLIGQFGVGFYSSFVVAKNVIVRSRKAGTNKDQGVYWESEGHGEFNVKNIEREQRGTEIVLHLKDEAEEFLNAWRLRTVIGKYSDHIMVPIMMHKPQDDTDEKKDAPLEWEQVNKASALWTQPKSDITDEQYNELYKHISHDYEDALDWTHSKVEGRSEYTMLLYVPQRAPADLWHRDQQRGLKLYVKRVFIMDDAEHFLPMYLRFVKGIVDSNDLPLNISREILQNNREIERMKAGCVKKVLSLLEGMAKNDAEKYAKFWAEFGQVIKEGPAEDFANKDRIAKLLRFSSTHDSKAEQDVTLEDYVARMRDKQDKIYYLIGDSFSAVANSPLLELYRKKNIEVLLLHDRIDEWLVSHLTEFDGKQLKAIDRGDVDESLQDEADKKEKAEQEKDFESVVKQMKEALGERVKEVRLTTRLTDSPCCVVFDDGDVSGHMARLLQATGQEVPKSAPILEINAKHPLLTKVKAESDDDKFNRWSTVLLSQALLAEGETLDDPAAFIKEMNALLV